MDEEEQEEVEEVKEEEDYNAHETSTVEADVEIGKGTNIWHYAHVREKAKLGKKLLSQKIG
ncbi:MAG: hypothetical protein ACLFU5_08605 [Thermoplasmata archaeon]